MLYRIGVCRVGPGSPLYQELAGMLRINLSYVLYSHANILAEV